MTAIVRMINKSYIVRRTSYIGAARRPRRFLTAPAHSSSTSRPHLLCQIPRNARELPKLTHRRPIGGSPFGRRLRAVHTHLQPSCVLTHRRPIGLVASESPHDCCFGVASRLLTPSGQKLTLLAKLAYSRRQFSPLRGKSYAFGQTDLQPSSVFTPAGQKLRFWPNWLTAVASFHPCGAAPSRCPYALTAVVRVVHRTSYIVHRRR